MSYQEIVNLIDITLIDGKLDEAERKMLVRQARAAGIDSAELESMIESRRLELNAGGLIRPATKKCPSCQALIQKEMMTSCEYCGASLTATLQSQRVDEFHSRLILVSSEKRHEMIKSYPLPTEKNEIIAFLSLSTPLALEAITFIPTLSILVGQDESHRNEERLAWLAKTQALIANSRVIYAGDTAMQAILDQYQAQIVSRKKEVRRNRLLTTATFVTVLIIANFKLGRFEVDFFWGLRKTTIGVLKMGVPSLLGIGLIYVVLKRWSIGVKGK
jgi:hypothetical protein